MALWNKLPLIGPKRDYSQYRIENNNVKESLSSLITALTSAADVIGHNHPVWAEIKIFRTIQLRLGSKLPCEKFLHIFQRVGRCTQRMVIMDLSKQYLDLAEMFLKGLSSSSKKTMLPSKSHLEYLLIRTQGASKLLCEAISYAKETFCHLLQRLGVGQQVNSLLMACSVIARISIYFRALLLQVCNMYKNIKPWCDKLNRGSWKWECEPELPDDLWQWLGPQESQMINRKDIADDTIAVLNDMLKDNCNKSQQSKDIMAVVENYIEDSTTGEITVEEKNHEGVLEDESGKSDNAADCEIEGVLEESSKSDDPADSDIEVVLEDESGKRDNAADSDIEEITPTGREEFEVSENKSTSNEKKKLTTDNISKWKKDIAKAKTFKKLLKLWRSMDKKCLSVESRKKIHQLFLEQKVARNSSDETAENAELKNTEVVAQVFGDNLTLKSNSSKSNKGAKSSVKRRLQDPAHTTIMTPTNRLKKLKGLLERVHREALSRNKLKFFKKVEKYVKFERVKIKHLRKNNAKKFAQFLTLKTSKYIIRKYEKLCSRQYDDVIVN